MVPTNVKGPRGRLFVVATPIGNLEDITARALRVLREADLIACEDTRHSRRLLDHYSIHTPLTSYHEHNEIGKTEQLLAALEQGKRVALITDAGTPCISDPGFRVVRAARARGIAVEAVPGPSAATAALSVAGLPTDRFAFHGFFPRKRREADELFRAMDVLGGTHVFYESPQRLPETLDRLAEAMPNAEVCVVRELTKMHEETVSGTPSDLSAHFGAVVRGECVLLVHAARRRPADDVTPEALRARVDEVVAGGASRRDAVRRVAEELSVPRNVVYAAAARTDRTDGDEEPAPE